MNMAVLLTLIGFAITITIFIITTLNSNNKFKQSQQLAYNTFETETRLKLVALEKELTKLKENIDTNKTEILTAYQNYKTETIQHTLEFRHETKQILNENKLEHNDIKSILGDVCEDVAFIRGKLSSAKEIKNNKRDPYNG